MTDEEKKRFEKVMNDYFEKNRKPTLYEICMDWWRDLHDTTDMNISIEELVNRIEKEWLPKEDPRPSYATMQWDKCVRNLKNRLR